MAGKSFKVQMNPTFNSAVKIPRVGGEPLNTTFTFKVFDRIELADVFDKWKKENSELIQESDDAKEAGKPFTMKEWTEREIQLQVKQVQDVVAGWGFSDEFTEENIEALVRTSVSVTDAILDQYNEAYTRARQGN